MRRQQIVETITCDKCGEDTDKPSTYHVRIGRSGMAGGAPIERIIDLCSVCAPIVAELHELLRRMPRNVGAESRQLDAGPRVECRVCGDDVARSHLSSHIVKKHRADVRQPPQCPDCDRPYGKSMMLKHRAAQHGYDHAAALIASLDASPKRKRNR